MEDSQINQKTNREADLQEKRIAELADAIRDLRKVIENHQGSVVEGACSDVECAAIHAELPSDLQTSIGYQLKAIESNMQFSPTQPTRRHTLLMVAGLENLIEEWI